MCAVCWTGAQIIPVSAIAGRYVWVNHLRGRRATAAETEPETAPEEDAEPVDA